MIDSLSAETATSLPRGIHNAALVILQRGLSTVEHTRTFYAWGDGTATLVGANLLGQGLSKN